MATAIWVGANHSVALRLRARRWRPARCQQNQSQSQSQSQSRRLVSISVSVSVVVSHLFLNTHVAAAAGIFDKYVKRKKLDPLDAYVPAVILSRLQLKDLENTLDGDQQPPYAFCRSLLRSGPAASLRINIRAVAQYAEESGNGKTAFDNVDQCLRALEELDSLLLRASRNDPEASLKSMKVQITSALDSLDGLLKTVPMNVLDKGQAIADSYKNAGEEEPPTTPPDITADPQLRQLESIL